jgi:hypothetical protein
MNFIDKPIDIAGSQQTAAVGPEPRRASVACYPPPWGFPFAMSSMQITTPETLEVLGSALTSLPLGEAVYITAHDFKKLTGDELTDFGSEGRFIIGNLSARTNCTVVTTDERVIFTKNPVQNPHTDAK